MGLMEGSGTLLQLFERGLAEHPNPRLLNYRTPGGSWKGISSVEAALRIRRVALGLFSQGIRPGDRVSILCEGRPDWTICDLAIMSLGAQVIPVYTTLSQ